MVLQDPAQQLLLQPAPRAEPSGDLGPGRHAGPYIYARSGEAGFPTQGPDPASQLLDKLGIERIVAAIDQLPDEYRIVSALYFMEDLSYEEIAQALECPVGTVRSRLHRGRKMLQKALWQIAEEDGIVRQPALQDNA
jgi:RNA polymerase sigma-70 factor (ECF subfamily)